MSSVMISTTFGRASRSDCARPTVDEAQTVASATQSTGRIRFPHTARPMSVAQAPRGFVGPRELSVFFGDFRELGGTAARLRRYDGSTTTTSGDRSWRSPAFEP